MQCKPYESFKMYIAAEICQNLKFLLLKRMHDNRTVKKSYAIKKNLTPGSFVF